MLISCISATQCLNEENYVVAHYNLKIPDRPAYGTSGNVLTVYESFAHLSIGGSFSRTVVRYFCAAKFTLILIRTSSIINNHAPHSPKQPVMFDKSTLTSCCCVYPTHKNSTVLARNSRPCIIRVQPHRNHAQFFIWDTGLRSSVVYSYLPRLRIITGPFFLAFHNVFQKLWHHCLMA